jgi:peptidoglycan/LPS O-acetylase OafA/YrhL
MESSTHTYYSRLDHLRFVAALMVLGWHAMHNPGIVPTSNVPNFMPLSLLEEGHTGVSLFMTLSGFIFYTLCRGKRIVYGEFLRNRLLRIAPLFVVWMLFYVYTMNLDVVKIAVATFALLNNGAAPGVTWTVIVECQFYLLFPFLMAFAMERGIRYLLGLVALLVLIRTSVWYTEGSVQALAYVTLFGRLDQFLLGMVASELWFRHRHALGRVWVLALVVLAWVVVYHRFNQMGGYWNNGGYPSPSPVWIVLPTLEGLFYGLIIASYLAMRLPVPRLLDAGLARLGTYSYSFYLNHLVIVTACARICTQLGWKMNGMTDGLIFTFAVALPVLALVSAFTYHLIEAPFLELRRPYLVTPRAIPAGSGVTAIASGGEDATHDAARDRRRA